MFIERIGANVSNVSRIHEKFLEKSVRRLSTGYRVNRSDDDPVGMSRRLKDETYLSSLREYGRSLTDRVSLGEIADNGLREINSVLSRMRDLSISAQDSGKTQSDRSEINDEMDLLKTEIDKLLESTEFNTRRLLNGTLSALPSSSDSAFVDPVVRGVGKDGTFSGSIRYEPEKEGANHVLTTNIFEVKTGLESIANDDYNGDKATATVAENYNLSGTLIFDFDGETISVDLSGAGRDTAITELQNDDNLVSYVNISSGGAANEIVFTSREYGTDSNSWDVFAFSTASKTDFTGGTDSINGITLVGNPSGLLSGTGYTVGLDDDITSGTAENSTNALALARYRSAGSTDISVLTGAMTAPTGGGYAMIEVLEDATISTTSGDFDIRYSFDGGDNWNSHTVDGSFFSATGVTLTDGLTSLVIGNTGLTEMTVETGDKYLFGLEDKDFADPAATHLELKMNAQVDNGYGVSAQSTTTYSFDISSIESSTQTLDVVQLDTTNGEWVTGSADLQFSAVVTGKTFTDVVEYDIDQSGGVANGLTPLSAVGTFFDDDGNFILSDSGNRVTLEIMDGTSVDVDFVPTETVADLEGKLRDAVNSLFSNVSMNRAAERNLVSYVSVADADSTERSAGTFIIRSPLPGEQGRIFIHGGTTDLDAAFAFSDVQAPDGEPFSADVDGEKLNLSGGEIHLPEMGLDLDVDERLLIEAGWSGRERNLLFSRLPDRDFNIVTKANPLRYASSISGGEDTYSIPDFSTKGLGIEKVDLSSIELSERAQELIDGALNRVQLFLGTSGGEIERASIREEYVSGVEAIREASISRLYGTDTAREYAEMTKRLMLQDVTATLLQNGVNFQESILSILTGS